MRHCPSAWILFALAVLLCGLAAGRVAAAETITDIQISGQRTVEPETIRSRLQLAKGAPYDAAKADQSIKALFATGIFSDVRIERRGATVHVRVVENPIIAGVSYQGNSAIDKAKLDEQVHLKPRMRYTPAKAHAEAVRVREHYRRQGRLATTVEAKATTRDDGRVDVVFVVKEGE